MNIRNIRKKLLKTWQYFHDTRLRYGPKECNIPEKKTILQAIFGRQVKNGNLPEGGGFSSDNLTQQWTETCTLQPENTCSKL